MQPCNGILRWHHHLQQVRKRTLGTLRGDIQQTKSSRTETQVREMLLLQEAHSISQTLNISRRNPTPPRKTGKYSKNASPKEPERSKAIPWTWRILLKVCTPVCRYFEGTYTPHKEGHRIQMDPRMGELFADTQRLFAKSPHPEITQTPRLTTHCTQMHPNMHMLAYYHSTAMAQTIPSPTWVVVQRISTKLGYPHERGLCNLHVCKETQLLHWHSKGNSKKRSLPVRAWICYLPMPNKVMILGIVA